MAEVWSSGIWQPKSGKEDEFVAAWRQFAQWSANAHGPAQAWLLRNRDLPGPFLSVGPWPNAEAIAEWRSDPEFQARIGGLRDLLDSFEARTFDPVATVG
jgi:heme-degrading monooxygenase HmoA